jgi:hypothetical protein
VGYGGGASRRPLHQPWGYRGADDWFAGLTKGKGVRWRGRLSGAGGAVAELRTPGPVGSRLRRRRPQFRKLRQQPKNNGGEGDAGRSPDRSRPPESSAKDTRTMNDDRTARGPDPPVRTRRRHRPGPRGQARRPCGPAHRHRCTPRVPVRWAHGRRAGRRTQPLGTPQRDLDAERDLAAIERLGGGFLTPSDEHWPAGSTTCRTPRLACGTAASSATASRPPTGASR